VRIATTLLAFSLAGAVAQVFAQGSADDTKVASYVNSLPPAKPPEYTEAERLALAANPLGCEEHPQAVGLGTNFESDHGREEYLWLSDGKPQIVSDYDHRLAFYGCHDWHSSVNSTWMMVSLIKSDPNIALGQQIRNELEFHIQKPNIDGEIDFFTHLQGLSAEFEKPYGFAWTLKLYGELKSWNDPEGKRAAEALEPLATWIEKAFSDYLNDLNYPVRIGLHPNTALDMSFVLDYVAQTNDAVMRKTIHDNAMRLFANDKHCPAQMEPVFGEFASPCLTEAALMSRVMAPAAYAKWLDDFLPPVYSEEFALYSKDIDAVNGNNLDTTGTEDEGIPNSHLIGLNFQRAADLEWILKGLPPGDARIPAYQRLANINGEQGYAKIGEAGYVGSHWLATYALMYENLVEGGAGK
jgi:hypothetical protein